MLAAGAAPVVDAGPELLAFGSKERSGGEGKAIAYRGHRRRHGGRLTDMDGTARNWWPQLLACNPIRQSSVGDGRER